MKAAFLDFATFGAKTLDLTPLYMRLPELQMFDDTSASLTASRIQNLEYVLTNKVKLTKKALQGAKNLCFIGLTATGSDNVDIATAKSLGIRVCNIRAYCTRSVVEHIFGVLINLSHNLNLHNKAVKKGEWQKSNNFCMLEYPIDELSNMTMGIIGYGELGENVANMAKHFGMKVMIAKRKGRNKATRKEHVTLRDLLKNSDVISLHCPLTDETSNLIGADELKLMKSNAILINTARGGLVDSYALVDALSNKTIKAAAIDVLPQEPPIEGNPLLDYSDNNLIVTPHIAWGTKEARQNAINELAENIGAFQNGKIKNKVV